MQVATIIGDIVDSRTTLDRDSVQRTFLAALDHANKATNPATPLRVTRGDEFEGSYPDLAGAWHASLLLRLLMIEHGQDLWMSVAWGEVTALAESPDAGRQDGPAWWAARDALDELKMSSRRRVPANRRTVFVTGGSYAGLEAAATLRDEVLAGLDSTDATITLGLMTDKPQKEIAEELGITTGVVSRRAHRNGLLSLAATQVLDR